MTLAGKSVVITGAGAGLGRAYAIAVAAAGADLVVNDIDDVRVREVVGTINDAGGNAVGLSGSVGDWDLAESLVRLAVSEYGQLDGLVNNAGVFHIAAAEDEDETMLRRTIDINVTGAAFVGTHAMKQMTSQGYGTIVNVTSGAHLGLPFASIYSASKGAVASMTYSWALEMEKHGVRVNAISPFAGTSMLETFAAAGMNQRNIPRPEQIAPLVVFMLGDTARLSGQVIRLDGTRLSILRHPQFILEAAVEKDAWTPEDIHEAWAAVLSLHADPMISPIPPTAAIPSSA